MNLLVWVMHMITSPRGELWMLLVSVRRTRYWCFHERTICIYVLDFIGKKARKSYLYEHFLIQVFSRMQFSESSQQFFILETLFLLKERKLTLQFWKTINLDFISAWRLNYSCGPLIYHPWGFCFSSALHVCSILDTMQLFTLMFACFTFRCDPQSLENALIKRVMVTPEEVITRTLDPLGAATSRDGLAKTIYSRLFDWFISLQHYSLNHSFFYSLTLKFPRILSTVKFTG